MIKMYHYFCTLLIVIAIIISSCERNKTDNRNTTQTDSISVQIKKLSEQIKENPNDANLFNKRAKVYLENKQVENALNDIKKAIEIIPSNSFFYCTLSDVYFSAGRVNNSLAALDKAISLKPDNVEALLKIAELNFYLRNYDKTQEFINQALEIDKINPKAYFLRGFVYKETGDTAKAIFNFQKTVELDPEYYHAYMQLGLLFSIKKDRLAADYFNNALNVNPKSIEARYALAMFYQENEEYNNAIETYTTILQIDPNYKYAHYNLGFIHLVYLKVYDVAASHFSNAIKSDTNYFEAYYNRGYCLELLGDVNNARRDYKKALKFNPNYPRAIDGLNRIDKLMNLK